MNSNYKKIYLKNDKLKSTQQILNVMKPSSFIILFGQKPLIKNKVFIELQAKKDNQVLFTDINYNLLSQVFVKNGVNTYSSNNCGTSYCNHLYFEILEHIASFALNSSVIFIHIPYIKNINNSTVFFQSLENVIVDLSTEQKCLTAYQISLRENSLNSICK